MYQRQRSTAASPAGPDSRALYYEERPSGRAGNWVDGAARHGTGGTQTDENPHLAKVRLAGFESRLRSIAAGQRRFFTCRPEGRTSTQVHETFLEMCGATPTLGPRLRGIAESRLQAPRQSLASMELLRRNRQHAEIPGFSTRPHLTEMLSSRAIRTRGFQQRGERPWHRDLRGVTEYRVAERSEVAVLGA